MSDLTYEYPAEVVMQRARETRAMIEEIERLREVLEFYASASTYSRPLTEYGWGKETPIEGDLGYRARAALKGAMSVE